MEASPAAVPGMGTGAEGPYGAGCAVYLGLSAVSARG